MWRFTSVSIIQFGVYMCFGKYSVFLLPWGFIGENYIGLKCAFIENEPEMTWRQYEGKSSSNLQTQGPNVKTDNK